MKLKRVLHYLFIDTGLDQHSKQEHRLERFKYRASYVVLHGIIQRRMIVSGEYCMTDRMMLDPTSPIRIHSERWRAILMRRGCDQLDFDVNVLLYVNPIPHR